MIARRVSSGRGTELFLAVIHAFFAAFAASAGQWLIAGCFAGAGAIGVLKAIRHGCSGAEIPRPLVWAEFACGLVGFVAIWRAWSSGVQL